ncbi:putative vomeronasal receptor-like protein 4 [Eulemur rufifrons]|uniref:putative vomeronasal receptor-like protein 4 n=1 Tax=Eulemur rufifrons TaxID=859984 RepID=UPI003743B90B
MFNLFKKAFFFQAGIGISANTFLLLLHIFKLHLEHRPKPTDVTSSHLAFVHIVNLLIEVILVSSELFESPHFGNDFKCKALLSLSRVMRGLSICTTCLLSMLQAITISPSTSWLARFKNKSTNDIFYILFFLWFLSLSFSSNLIIYAVSSSNRNQTNLIILTKYCSLSPMSYIIKGLFVTLTISGDVSFVGIMLLSSAYMVIFLSRHQRRSQHLHSTSLSPRASPEKRATQTILLLVSIFVVIYWVDLIISIFSILLWAYDPVLLGSQRLVANVYVTVSPLVLLSSDKRIINIFQNLRQKVHQLLID